MKFDPDIHHRRSIRLKDYDYSRAGAYFVTVCGYGRICLFGTIVDGQMQMNDFGSVAAEYWSRLPNHYGHIVLDAFVVMPNHVHGIIMIIDDIVGAGFKPAPTNNAPHTAGAGFKPAPTIKRHGLPEIVRAFKTFSAKHINRVRNMPGLPVWQRNYYEHIIRNEDDLSKIREYIVYNPARWADDEENPNKR